MAGLPDTSKADLGVAAGLTGFAVWQLLDAWRKNVPDLERLRAAADDPEATQALRDGELVVGSFALLAALTAGLMARSWLPVVVVAAGLAVLVVSHHGVLRGPPATG